MTDNRRTCPIVGCLNTMADYQVMCRTHWFQVPKSIRTRVWNEYQTAPGGPEHLAAIRAAIKAAMEADA